MERQPLCRDDERLRWLHRRAEEGGFGVEVVTVASTGAFREALAEGIGPAKAYGFGLLSIAKVP